MIQFVQKCTLEENEYETNETDFIKKHFKNALETKKTLIEIMVHVYFELLFHYTTTYSVCLWLWMARIELEKIKPTFSSLTLFHTL